MAMKIEPLLRKFLQTKGQALYLVPGECNFMLLGGERVVVNREPLSQELFRAAAAELAPGKDIAELVRTRHKFKLAISGLEITEVCFHARGSKPAIMFRRFDLNAPAAPPPKTEPAAAPVPAPAPAAPPRAAKAEEPVEMLADSGGPVEPAAGRPAIDMSLPPEEGPLELELSQAHIVAPGQAAPAPAPAPSAAVTHSPPTEMDAPKELEDDRDIIKPIDRILLQALKLGASDVHIVAFKPPFVRLGGELQAMSAWNPFSQDQLEASLVALLPDAPAQLARSKEVDCVLSLTDGERFRASIFRDRVGTCMTFWPIMRRAPAARTLGLSPAALGLLDLPRGLVVVAGPPRSGKSTVLASFVGHMIQSRPGPIVSLERPVEFLHPTAECFLHQREVGVHTDTFLDGLRAALLQDPEVIVLGEIADPGIALLATQAAHSHLVVAALPAASATLAVETWISLLGSAGPALLSSVLAGVVALTLCPKKTLGKSLVCEQLLMSPAVGDAIRERKTGSLFSIMQAGRNAGMCSQVDALLELVKRGEVTPAEARSRAVDRSTFAETAKAAGIVLPPGP